MLPMQYPNSLVISRNYCNWLYYYYNHTNNSPIYSIVCDRTINSFQHLSNVTYLCWNECHIWLVGSMNTSYVHFSIESGGQYKHSINCAQKVNTRWCGTTTYDRLISYRTDSSETKTTNSLFLRLINTISEALSLCSTRILGQIRRIY